jgi:hypothetical protein
LWVLGGEFTQLPSLLWRSSRLQRCEIFFFAKDGRLHRHVVEAGIKFEAAKARDDVVGMWWYDRPRSC